MESELTHELAAAYALNALDHGQEREYEIHLAGCRDCQEDVAAFSEVAAALAFAAAPAEPSSELRGRILARAQDERSNVVALRPRWAYPALAAASIAACAAVGFGVWAVTLDGQLGSTTALRALPLRGASGSVVLSNDGHAILVVSGIAPAPAGETYEIWVSRNRTPRPAGLFSPRGPSTTVRLDRRVPHGGMVAVTLEPAGGSSRPSETPLFTSSSRA